MYTAYDVIEYLMSSTGGGAQDDEHRVLRQAVFHAYRDLVALRDWKWYQAADVLPLQSDDLIATYRLPWGVSSVDAVYLPQLRVAAEYVNQTDWLRIATSPLQQLIRLAWTVLPSAERIGYYDLKIYNGYRYNEDVTLTYRRRPRDIRLTGWEPSSRVGTITTATTTGPSGFATLSASVSGGQITAVTVSNGGRGFTLPPAITVIPVGGGSGAILKASIADGSVKSVAIISGGSGYANTPVLAADPPEGLTPGTFFSVTGSGTQFHSRMNGAVLRASGDAVFHPEGSAGMRPYIFEAFITSEPSSPTVMTVQSPEGGSVVTGSRYLVTDLLDISPTMYTALLSGTEVWVARLTGKNTEQPSMTYGRDLRLAFEHDVLAPESGRRLSAGGYFSFWYLRPGTDQGT